MLQAAGTQEGGQRDWSGKARGAVSLHRSFVAPTKAVDDRVNTSTPSLAWTPAATISHVCVLLLLSCADLC